MIVVTCLSDSTIQKEVRKCLAQKFLEVKDHFVISTVCGRATIAGGVGYTSVIGITPHVHAQIYSNLSAK